MARVTVLISLMITALLTVITPIWAQAPAPAPTPTDWTGMLGPVIIAIVPLVVMVIRKHIHDQWVWVIPILATFLGTLATFFTGLSTSLHLSAWAMVAIGLASVGLREVVNQLGQVTGFIKKT